MFENAPSALSVESQSVSQTTITNLDRTPDGRRKVHEDFKSSFAYLKAISRNTKQMQSLGLRSNSAKNMAGGLTSKLVKTPSLGALLSRESLPKHKKIQKKVNKK